LFGLFTENNSLESATDTDLSIDLGSNSLTFTSNPLYDKATRKQTSFTEPAEITYPECGTHFTQSRHRKPFKGITMNAEHD